MLYNPPTGGAANDPYVGKNVAAGIQGSKVPPGAVEFPQREIMAIIAADPSLTPSNTDLGQAQKSIAYQIEQAIGAIPSTPPTSLWHTGSDSSSTATAIVATAT
ncbi:hypothetical protein, partial [Beijerinckia sp. L45]|uniref:hypothetical protein n=1 Tax=Beijerinckia sp. L45 TaxID=1641855 RepID=UPI001AEE6A8A